MENNKENELLSKGYFKSIPLYPTEFHVDVWICDKEELSRNQVFTVVATSESELKGIKTIVANMDSWDAGTIVHELNHVIFHLSNICHLEIGYNSQEWVSYMIEYLFNRCKNDGSFLVMP
jgi:hypothetical protein